METEKRLIDADEFKECPVFYCGGNPDDPYYSGYCDALDNVQNHLEFFPSVDAVEVVRCKDCKYWKPGDSKGGNSIEDLQVIGGCTWTNFCRRERDFCSFGERKDNG